MSRFVHCPSGACRPNARRASRGAVVALALAIAGCSSGVDPRQTPVQQSVAETGNTIWIAKYETNSIWLFSAAVDSAGNIVFPLSARPPVAVTRGQVAARSEAVDSATPFTGPPAQSGLQTIEYMAFDASGDMWVSANANGATGVGTLLEYTPFQLAKGGQPTPIVTVTGLQLPEGLAFDNASNMWVVDWGLDEALEYSPSQRSSGKVSTPSHVVSLAGLDNDSTTFAPLGLAFDAQGDAWVSVVRQSATRSNAANVPNYEVVEFTASQLAGGGSPTPTVTLANPTLGANGASGYGPGVAFDGAGNLWTANVSLASLTKFAAGGLTPGANPAPVVIITAGPGVLDGAFNVAFDSIGTALVAGGQKSSETAALVAYSPDELLTTGSPQPETIDFPGPHLVANLAAVKGPAH